jgi:hypothetical protein
VKTKPITANKLIKEITIVSSKQVDEAAKQIVQNGSDHRILALLSQAIMEGMKPDEWTGIAGYEAMIKRGIYTPMQLLFDLSSRSATINPNYDYPFLFGTVGCLVSTLTGNNSKTKANDSERYRKLFQTLFRMRELKEEGENLSVETYLPDAIKNGAGLSSSTLDLKKLGLVFGRGTGVVTTSKFSRRTNVNGTLYDLFTDHTGAPSYLLYTLGQANSNVPESNLSVSLKRDRNVTVSAKNNPLLEFYDGGWHVVDLSSGRTLLEYCLDLYEDIGEQARESEVTQVVLALAYHMATHWHSGILCVIDHDKAMKEEALEEQSPWSKSSTDIIRDSLKKKGPFTDFKITEVEKTGYGRVILTNAIQDGATVFLPDGQFHSAGRVVKNFVGELADPTLGTGNRAARRLAKFGIALKVSKDGAIRLYSSKPVNNKLLNQGLRIR